MSALNDFLSLTNFEIACLAFGVFAGSLNMWLLDGVYSPREQAWRFSARLLPRRRPGSAFSGRVLVWSASTGPQVAVAWYYYKQGEGPHCLRGWLELPATGEKIQRVTHWRPIDVPPRGELPSWGWGRREHDECYSKETM